MKDEEIIAIAKQIWGENLGIGDGTSEPVGFVEGWCDVKPTSKVIAFARFIADLQKVKDGDILSEALQSDLEHGVKWLNEKAAKEFHENYPALSAAMGEINSPETELDMWLRRQ